MKIYVRKGNEFSFHTIEDLTGKKGLFPAGGSYGDEFDNYAQKLDLEGKTTLSDVFLYLMKGTADYAIQNENKADSYINENALDNKIVALNTPLLTISGRFGYSRQSRCVNLLQKFKQKFAQMDASGELARLRLNYLQPN